MLEFTIPINRRKTHSLVSSPCRLCFSFILLAVCYCNSNNAVADEGPASRGRIDDPPSCDGRVKVTASDGLTDLLRVSRALG